MTHRPKVTTGRDLNAVAGGTGHLCRWSQELCLAGREAVFGTYSRRRLLVDIELRV
jgi:hypothetical protein